MAHLDIAETQKLLRQQHRASGQQVRRQATFAALLLFLGGGYLLWHGNAAKSAPPAAPAAMPVATQVLHGRSVKLFAEFSGRIDAVDYAELRPQVSGRITEIRFQDGQTVKAGDVLFVIDPRPFQAAVAKAAADLQTARTNAALAQVNLARAENLKKAGAIAMQGYDQAVNASAVANAAIASASAVLEQARLDVDHAYVKAPISGKISRAEITLGNLVSATPRRRCWPPSPPETASMPISMSMSRLI
jgi:multidrug efflux system membrane fusion protein